MAVLAKTLLLAEAPQQNRFARTGGGGDQHKAGPLAEAEGQKLGISALQPGMREDKAWIRVGFEGPYAKRV